MGQFLIHLVSIVAWGLTYNPVLGAVLCPDKCHCDVEAKIYDCTNSDLEGIPIFFHPGLRVLKARNGRISKLEDAVNLYRQLEILDLSGMKKVWENRLSPLALQRLFFSNHQIYRRSIH